MGWNVILFDFDGTLCDSGVGITRCAAHALKALGFPVGELDTLRYFIGPPLESSFRDNNDMTEQQVQEGVRLFRARYAEKGVHEHESYPGVAEMLRALRDAGKRLCIASSKPRVFVEEILASYGVLDYFEQVVGCELDGRFGTKTLVLEELMRRLDAQNGDKADMVMVGDRKYDIEGAHNIGLPCVAVLYGYGEADELRDAEFVVGTVGELQSLLLRD